jgi:predicted ATPase with chaperone activity
MRRRRHGEKSIDIARRFTNAREHDLSRASDRKASVVNRLLSNRAVQRNAAFFSRKRLGPVRNQQVISSSLIAGSIFSKQIAQNAKSVSGRRFASNAV